MVADLRNTTVKRSAPPSVPRGAPVVYFLEDSDNDDNIPDVWGFNLVDPTVPSDLTRDSSTAQPPVEPSHLHLDSPTTPSIDCTTISPVETERPTPCQFPRPSPPHLTTSGPCAAHFTIPGPRAVHPTLAGPSADLTTTSTDLGDRARFPPSYPTSPNHRTPTPPTPSASTSDRSALLT